MRLETETERDMHRGRKREGQRERKREGQKERERDREKEREREREIIFSMLEQRLAIRPSAYPMSSECVCLCTFFHETGGRVLQG